MIYHISYDEAKSNIKVKLFLSADVVGGSYRNHFFSFPRAFYPLNIAQHCSVLLSIAQFVNSEESHCAPQLWAALQFM